MNTEPTPTALDWSNSPIAAEARRHVAARKVRSELFAHRRGLFCDPAWDIMVDLFVSHIDARPASISDVCLASGAPMTTGLRHVSVLERAGLITKKPDERDGRRFFVGLTGTGLTEMVRFFDVTAR